MSNRTIIVTTSDLHRTIKKTIKEKDSRRIKPYTVSEALDEYYNLFMTAIGEIIAAGGGVRFSGLFIIRPSKNRYLMLRTSENFKRKLSHPEKHSRSINIVIRKRNKTTDGKSIAIILRGGKMKVMEVEENEQA